MRYRVDRRPKDEPVKLPTNEEDEDGASDDFGLEDELDFDDGSLGDEGESDGGFGSHGNPSDFDDEGPLEDPGFDFPDPDFQGPEFGFSGNQGSGGTKPKSVASMIAGARKSAQLALNKANNKLSKKLSPADKAVFDKWFPGATAAEKAAITQTLAEAGALIGSVSIQSISSPAPAGPFKETHDANQTIGLKAAVIAVRLVNGQKIGVAKSDQFVAVYPGWLAKPGRQATILVHEIVHFTDPGKIGHDLNSNTDNAYRFQGFVSEVAGLTFSPSNVRAGAGV